MHYHSVCYATEENCTYLFDDFSGTSNNDWSNYFGNWTITGHQVEADVTTDEMYAYAVSLLPEKTSIIDTDLESLAGAHIDAAYGIFP